jgi:hypothetical protein
MRRSTSRATSSMPDADGRRSTTIGYRLAEPGAVRLAIYDILGRQVALLVNEMQRAGAHRVEFSARALSSGVYFYRLQAGAFTQVRKLLLLR